MPCTPNPCLTATTGRAAWHARRRGLRTLVEHLVDQAVGLGLGRRHPVVAFHVGRDLFHGLTGALRVDAVELLAGLEDLTHLDLDVGRLALRTTRGLVDHHARIWQRGALA